MTRVLGRSQFEAPSVAKIVTATVAALIVASIILVVAVLPAEYGIDPLHTGKALGLMELANTAEAKKPAQVTSADPASTSIAPVVSGETPSGAPRIKGTFIPQKVRYKSDSREIQLAPGEGMEIKYHMPKGGGLVYSWKSSGKVAYEFHGEPDRNSPGARIGYYESYDLDDKEGMGKDEFHGTFVAPSEGVQGWFWQNNNDKPVTLNLVSSGFYDWIFQNRDDKETILQPTDPK
jgi:hypothetical protein